MITATMKPAVNLHLWALRTEAIAYQAAARNAGHFADICYQPDEYIRRAGLMPSCPRPTADHVCLSIRCPAEAWSAIHADAKSRLGL